MSYLTKIGLTRWQEMMFITRSLKQIRQRNLAIPYGFNSYVNSREITDRVEKPSMWILHANYHGRYSSRQSWWIRASYLCGHSDKQDWAVRIPGTITIVKKALDWLTPTAVKQAIDKKKRVYRQGDMYFVPMRISRHDMAALGGTRHEITRDASNVQAFVVGKGNLTILHPQHPPAALSGDHCWRAYQQKQLHVGNTRVGAD
jgi:hypothetical protein